MNHFVRHLESKYDASTKPFEEFATEIAEYAFFDCDHSDIGYKRRGVSIVDSFQSCDRTFRGLMSTLRFCPEFDVKEYSIPSTFSIFQDVSNGKIAYRHRYTA
jgi:hypothetical protein